jgi:26S proteasome regulatory subunit N8
VGVEHLLRDVNDPSTSSLALRVRQQAEGLAALVSRLEEIRAYLSNVVSGRLPMNNQIMYNLQSIFCMLPNLNVEAMARALQVKTNDMYLVVYLSALMRSVVALHNLLNNKIQHRDVDDVLDRSAGVHQLQPAAAAST